MRILNKSALPDPVYQTANSACFDIASAVDLEIGPSETAIVPTGLYIDEPVPTNLCLEIKSRSGLAAKKSVIVLNAPGVVDADYKDEIKVILHNFGRISFKIKAGDRIAQGMVVEFKHADGMSVLSHIRSGGLGSTGV